MKTGEKWKRGDLSAIAVVFDDKSVRLFNVKADCDCFYLNAGIAVERGWVKTHEADGTPFIPKPQPGEVWSLGSGAKVWIGGNGIATFSDGSYVAVTTLNLTRRLYPPMEDAK